MHIITKRTLDCFWQRHPDAKQPLLAWYYEAKHAQWTQFQDIRDKYRSADVLAGNRVIFNIGGNKYRLIVKVEYQIQAIYIRFIGTHAEYDKLASPETL